MKYYIIVNDKVVDDFITNYSTDTDLKECAEFMLEDRYFEDTNYHVAVAGKAESANLYETVYEGMFEI